MAQLIEVEIKNCCKFYTKSWFGTEKASNLKSGGEAHCAKGKNNVQFGATYNGELFVRCTGCQVNSPGFDVEIGADGQRTDLNL